MRKMWIEFLNTIKNGAKTTTVNLRQRLLIFLLMLMITMLAGVMFVLSVFGVFSLGYDEMENLFLYELNSLSDSLSTQYGNATVRAGRMSNNISVNITSFMKKKNLSPDDIKNHPELLEPLMNDLLPILLTNLDATDCSGVFVTLDATVNPSLTGSENSKAGLFIQNVEPNIGGMGHHSRYLLRGFASLAGDSSLNLQARWDLEFNIRNQPFWREPLNAYENDPTLPLSRLVYWGTMCPVQDVNEMTMIASVPLLDESGNFLGVCGFVINEMNFMLRYEPAISGFHNVVFSFTSTINDQIRLSNSLFSGNNTIYKSLPKQGFASKIGSTGNFGTYVLPGGASYTGMNRAIRLYPDDSPFAIQSFLTAIFVPKADFDSFLKKERRRFSFILILLTLVGITASVLLSRRYIKPLTDKMNEAALGKMPEKTNITEIDLLLERFKASGSPIPINLFDEFLAKIKKLTPTEMIVFQAHEEGKSIEMMAKNIYVSVNTLKKHNSHIYEKLEVTSMEELRLYISLLKKCGMIDKIYPENG